MGVLSIENIILELTDAWDSFLLLLETKFLCHFVSK